MPHTTPTPPSAFVEVLLGIKVGNGQSAKVAKRSFGITSSPGRFVLTTDARRLQDFRALWSGFYSADRDNIYFAYAVSTNISRGFLSSTVLSSAPDACNEEIQRCAHTLIRTCSYDGLASEGNGLRPNRKTCSRACTSAPRARPHICWCWLVCS